MGLLSVFHKFVYRVVDDMLTSWHIEELSILFGILDLGALD